MEDARKGVRNRSAWRIEGTLREFPKFPPVNLCFDYPVHVADESGALGDIQPEDVLSMKEQMIQNRKKQAEEKKMCIRDRITARLPTPAWVGVHITLYFSIGCAPPLCSLLTIEHKQVVSRGANMRTIKS